MIMRIGFGYDIHRLVKDRELILGGVAIPFEKGLIGHSDADVLTHAICDALLGAAGEGDIGCHFPDSEPAFKDVSSIYLLSQSYEIIRGKGFSVVNIDATIMAEAPMLQPYRAAMQQNIAATLENVIERVNVKATTMEGLGMIGRGEGMAAMSVALITK